MLENKHETIEDLLADRSFRAWVLKEPGDHLSFWETWIEQHPEKKPIAEEAAAIVKGLPFAIREKEVSPHVILEEWERLQERISSEPSRRAVKLKGVKRSPVRLQPWILRGAASIALLAAFGTLLYYYVLNPVKTYQTPFGEQMSIVLPDSTSIELNANSSLSYRKLNPRSVRLDGEAFFRVQKKPATGAKFFVITEDLTIEVLGTAFNVVKRGENTEVVLEEGSVKLNLNRDFQEELYMTPGEFVSFSSKKNEALEKRTVETKELTSWKDGVLPFNDAPLSQVMKTIEEIYGWRAQYHYEELRKTRVQFPLPSDNFEEAILILEQFLNQSYDIKMERVEEEKVLLLH